MDDSIEFAQAVAEAWNAFPDLVGADWPEFESKFLIWLRLLETPGEDHALIRDQMLAYIANYPAARTKLVESFAQVAPLAVRSVGHRPQSTTARHLIVPVYYGTDRAPTGRTEPNGFFGGDRGDLSLGVVDVSIPDDHRMGRLEKPRWWKLQFSENPDKHVMLLGLEPLDRDHFVARSRRELAHANESHALIFVHGFWVTFQEAARRAAQLAADLNFGGLPMLYSWPSEGAAAKYTVDEGNVDRSRPYFRKFLELVMSELGVQAVSIVAHSMGNRALAETLAAFDPAELPTGGARLRQIVFAAPDVDQESFENLAKSFAGRADRFTLYASSADKALMTSQKVHKYRRAGDVAPQMLVVDKVDSVDATNVDTSFLGHSYYGDNRSVISDLFQLVRHNHSPDERGLAPRQLPAGTYWTFK